MQTVQIQKRLSKRASHQELHCVPFCFYFLTNIPTCNSGHVQVQRWKSPLQKHGDERVLLTCNGHISHSSDMAKTILHGTVERTESSSNRRTGKENIKGLTGHSFTVLSQLTKGRKTNQKGEKQSRHYRLCLNYQKRLRV